jgi:sugar diacid utilization regulator
MESLPSVKAFPYGSNLICIAHSLNTGDEGLLNKLSASIDNMIEDTQIRVGASDCFSLLSNIHLAYKEALLALRYGTRLSKSLSKAAILHPVTGVYEFLRIFPYFVTDVNRDGNQFMSEYLRAGRIPLLIAALEERFAHTFTHFVLSGFEVYAAADILNMHRNTVRYQVNNVKERLGLDLGDSSVRQYLYILFCAMETTVPLAGRPPADGDQRPA